ncbi:MAG: hypothetical protein ACREJ3_17545 [Polyangiaceae bacterium]
MRSALCCVLFAGMSCCAVNGAAGPHSPPPQAAASAASGSAAVAPAPPPKDDGKPAEGGHGGPQHAAALEQLKVAGLGWAEDRQHTVRVLLPDAGRWLRVKFWGMKSLVGFRYGKEHHAVVGAVVVHVPDEKVPGACTQAFEAWTEPYIDAFEVDIAHDPPKAAVWNGKIADIASLVATTATLGMHDQYAASYGIYHAWPGACLVLGIAIPARGELERAKAVRDRFAAEVLPKVQVMGKSAPTKME